MTTAASSPDPIARPAEDDLRFALMDLALSYLFPAALRAAALGVADHLADGPRPVAELAGAVGADPLNLHRVLRLLATRGILTEDDAGRFALTPSAELLRTDVPSSFAPAVLMITDTTFWRPAGELEETVRTGRTPFDRLFGMPFFEHFARDPETAAVFHVGMAFTGRERTRADFDALFARAGFRLTRVLPTDTRLSIVEGVPAT